MISLRRSEVGMIAKKTRTTKYQSTSTNLVYNTIPFAVTPDVYVVNHIHTQ
jgi:hypothetical protein